MVDRLNQRASHSGDGSAAEAEPGLAQELAQQSPGMASRDLTVERAEEQTPEGEKQIAFYAANSGKAPGGARVIRITLKHAERASQWTRRRAGWRWR